MEKIKLHSDAICNVLSFDFDNLELVDRLVFDFLQKEKHYYLKSLIDIKREPNDFGICFISVETLGAGPKALKCLEDLMNLIYQKIR